MSRRPAPMSALRVAQPLPINSTASIYDASQRLDWVTNYLWFYSNHPGIGIRTLVNGVVGAGGGGFMPVFVGPNQPQVPAAFGNVPVYASPQSVPFSVSTRRAAGMQPAGLYLIPTPQTLYERQRRLKAAGNGVHPPRELLLMADDPFGSEFFIATVFGTPQCHGATVWTASQGADGKTYIASASQACLSFDQLTPLGIETAPMGARPLRCHFRSLPSRPQQRNRPISYGAQLALVGRTAPVGAPLRALSVQAQVDRSSSTSPEVLQLRPLEEVFDARRPASLPEYLPYNAEMPYSPTPAEFTGAENALYASWPLEDNLASSTPPLLGLGVQQLPSGIQALATEAFCSNATAVVAMFPGVRVHNASALPDATATPCVQPYQYRPQSIYRAFPQSTFA